MKEFGGGYYFAILELMDTLDEEHHTKELFSLFEDMFGSGNLINFRKALKKLKETGRINFRKGKSMNRVYYSKIKKKS
jgi:hypothetical protein